MANRVIRVDQLGETIDEILKEYGDEVEKNIDEVTKKIGQKGAAAVRTSARSTFGGSGKYAKGWTATTQKMPHYTSVVIHNKAVPGLPHLLEHGHALVMGGRKLGEVSGREHIAPVESELIEQYQIKVIEVL